MGIEVYYSEHGKERTEAYRALASELDLIEDSMVITQKILSCVVRTEQRYGAGHLTDVLRGADTQRIRRIAIFKQRLAKGIHQWSLTMRPQLHRPTAEKT